MYRIKKEKRKSDLILLYYEFEIGFSLLKLYFLDIKVYKLKRNLK